MSRINVFGPVLVAVCTICILCSAVRADVHPSPIFSDGVVLQRDAVVPIYGSADPNEKVTVSIANDTASTIAGADGKWIVKLGPLKVGGPYTLTISGKNVVTISNVLVGDIWVCSGQSNMTYQIAWFDRSYYTNDIAQATDSNIHEFDDSDNGSMTPQTDANGAWTVCSPDTVIHFSTVAYFFAKTLRDAMPGVPIGIVHSSVGGTAAEPWTPMDFLQKDSKLAAEAAPKVTAFLSLANDKAQFPIALAAWEKTNSAIDAGNSGFAQGWAAPDADQSSWKAVQFPTNLAQSGFQGGGVVWYRKTVMLSTNAADKAFDINLNWNDSVLDVYFNGTPLAPNNRPDPFYATPQSFHVPQNLIKAGQPNTVAIRQYTLTNAGYIWLPSSDMGLPVADPTTLDNTWSMRAEQTFPPLSVAALAALPKAPQASMNGTPSTLYNGKIAPIMPFAIKGVLWYQGESNAPNAPEYGTILPLLIAGWRTHWGEGDFPFYIVQLANYGEVPAQPRDDSWARVRDAQLLTSEHVPNTGLVVTIDTATRHEIIHPADKQDVGHRAGLVALALTYKQKLEYAGPTYVSYSIEGGEMRIKFSHAEGLMGKSGPLQWFEIAGADQKFVWANAVIDGNTVVVSSPSVTSPVAVRYAWAGNPFGCNLYNGAGLPASPFRTDTWN